MRFLGLALLLLVHCVDAIQVPASKCYAFDGDYRLHDFTPWIGHELEHATDNGDLTLRFCKDVQLRSNSGYVNFGRFVPARFVSSGSTDFVQDYSQGDVNGCETNGYDTSGRTSQVSVVCGNCSGSLCRDPFGCICNSTSLSSSCRYSLVVAVKCSEKVPRVPKGFTVGFNPRGREVVDNGIPQWGFERFHDDYSFATEQRSVSLYLTAPAAMSNKVQKASVVVSPSKGLSVKLAGSAANGDAPTTESPTVLSVDWQCDDPKGGPYSVGISIPVQGFDPIGFTLAKNCDHKQTYRKGGSSGWATFGMLCLIILLVTSCCCCLGFCYNTRVEHKDGLEALPGVTFLANYLGSARTSSDGYQPAQDAATGSSSSSRPTNSKYGTV